MELRKIVVPKGTIRAVMARTRAHRLPTRSEPDLPVARDAAALEIAQTLPTRSVEDGQRELIDLYARSRRR